MTLLPCQVWEPAGYMQTLSGAVRTYLSNRILKIFLSSQSSCDLNFREDETNILSRLCVLRVEMGVYDEGKDSNDVIK